MSDHDRLDRALDDLLADRSPRSVVGGLQPLERRMLRLAQLLRGRSAPGPSVTFVESLRSRLLPELRQRYGPHGYGVTLPPLWDITVRRDGVIEGGDG